MTVSVYTNCTAAQVDAQRDEYGPDPRAKQQAALAALAAYDDAAYGGPIPAPVDHPSIDLLTCSATDDGVSVLLTVGGKLVRYRASRSVVASAIAHLAAALS
jgi:hypothetical protein